jgi:hypothetical protein
MAVPQRKYPKVGAVLGVAPCLSRALESSNAAMLARFFDDVLGIASLAGKNSTVSTI